MTRLTTTNIRYAGTRGKKSNPTWILALTIPTPKLKKDTKQLIKDAKQLHVC